MRLPPPPRVMRELATRWWCRRRTIISSIVGTGGDGAHTCSMSRPPPRFVAAAGARWEATGNRSVSSKSAIADVLEALG